MKSSTQSNPRRKSVLTVREIAVFAMFGALMYASKAALDALPGGKESRIYLCLAEIDVTKIMRAKRAGAYGYLLKPFNRESISEILPSTSVG